MNVKTGIYLIKSQRFAGRKILRVPVQQTIKYPKQIFSRLL